MEFQADTNIPENDTFRIFISYKALHDHVNTKSCFHQ